MSYSSVFTDKIACIYRCISVIKKSFYIFFKFFRRCSCLLYTSRGGTKCSIGVQTGKKADGSPAVQMVEMLFIPEGDLYRLIAHSKLPSAERFEQWVFDEVLPAIRKHGAYLTKEKLWEIATSPEALILSLIHISFSVSRYCRRMVSRLIAFTRDTSIPDSWMSAGIRSTPSGWCRIPSPGRIGSSIKIRPIASDLSLIHIY